jgi:hypothetical protein
LQAADCKLIKEKTGLQKSFDLFSYKYPPLTRYGFELGYNNLVFADMQKYSS